MRFGARLGRAVGSGLLAVLIAGGGAGPALAADADVTLDPTHGELTAKFTATYRVALRACKPLTVTFDWDGKPLGDATLAADCTAKLTVRPPNGTAFGPHLIDAGFCDALACHPSGRVIYVVDRPAPPTSPPTAKPTPKATPPPTPQATPPPTPKPTPPPTPIPASTPTPEPTPSPTPTAPVAPTASVATTAPSASPSGAVLGAVGSPGGGEASDDPGGTTGTAGGEETGAGDFGPSLAMVAAVAGPDAVSIDLDVLGTNLILTLVVLLTFGLTSSLFNSTIKSNRGEIDGWVADAGRRLRPITRPFAGLAATVGSVTGRRMAGRAVRVVIILGLTGLVYAYLSPDFAFDARGALLFVSIVLGVGFVTYLSEGGGSLVANRRLHAPASVRLYVAAVLVAVVCVLVSRLMDFQPGILYGFVASNVVLASVVLDRRRSAQLVLIPALALLLVALTAWAALLVVRPIVAADGLWWQIVVEAVLVTIFVAGIEGVFYSMIPITFMDGAAVFAWSRIAWALLFGIATFLFWHLLLNQHESYLDALRQTRVAVALGLVILYGALTLGTWLFFRFRNRTVTPSPA